MNTHTTHHLLIRLFLGSVLSVALMPVIAATILQEPSQLPLSIGTTGVAPNIMLMVDNSYSMTNYIESPLRPSDMPSSFTYTCTTAERAGGATLAAAVAVNMQVSGTTPKICSGSSNCNTSSNFSATKCFNNTQYYNVTYYNGSPLGKYIGLQLNWYFSQGPTVAGTNFKFTSTAQLNALSSLNITSTDTTRLKMAKDAAKTLITNLKPDTTKGEAPSVRLGLSSFDDDNDGGKLINAIQLLDTAYATTLTTSIGASDTAANANSQGNINTNSVRFTPLAETLAAIGRYFALGETGSLITHPDTTKQSKTITEIFDTGGTGALAGVSGSTEKPLQLYCQRNATILVTDGLPNKDRKISTVLRNYSGDCKASAPLGCVDTPGSEGSEDLPKDYVTLLPTGSTCSLNSTTTSRNNIACKNGTKAGRIYEKIGSDYLDDVAQALYEMDLRPSMTDWPTTLPGTKATITAEQALVKNNVKTYTVGIADPMLKAESEDKNQNGILDTGEDTNANGILDLGTILKDAAAKGGGSFAYADNATALVAALDKMVSDIKKDVGSFSAIVANSTQLGAGSALYQAKYDTADWTGDFIALPLDATTGAVLAPNWNAGEKSATTGEKILSCDNQPSTSKPCTARNVYSYGATSAFTFKGASAVTVCGYLSADQKTELGISSCVATDEGVMRLDWLRGDTSHEIINTSRQLTYNQTANLENPADPRASTYSAVTPKIFRNRARFYDTSSGYNETKLRQDPWLLGDIVNSDAAYVYDQNYGYATKGGITESGYSTFVTSKSSWKQMIYVGANDGMLHGFDAKLNTDGYTDGGKEIFAYMPRAVYYQLKNLSSPEYQHHYFVDGSPKVGDVYWGTGANAAWHTVLVGTTGAGAKGIFALDITDPTNASAPFSTSDVLWDISISDTAANSKGPKTTDITTDTTTFRGFQNNLGYTMPQPSIVKMNDGSWAAIVANGYASTNGTAVLYVIDIKTGYIIAELDTKKGNTTIRNGLSTPFAADIDGNGTADAIYAGDLLGNMWKFDVSQKNNTSWKVAYGTSTTPAPLFTTPCSDNTSTTTCENTRQAITNKPQIGRVDASQASGVMVYFGTGKYFEDIDNSTTGTQTQSFYGIWDNCTLDANVTGAASVCTTVPKTDLLQQSIVSQTTVSDNEVRVTSNNAITYPAKKGWYINFEYPVGTNKGERIVSASLLRGNRIVFVTLIPHSDSTNIDLCATNSKSTSWLMELNALSGGRLADPVLDINNSGNVDDQDKLTVDASVDPSGKAPASGIQTKNGSTKTPAVMNVPGKDEIKFTGSSSGKAPTGIAESPAQTSDTDAARQSWRQL